MNCAYLWDAARYDDAVYRKEYEDACAQSFRQAELEKAIAAQKGVLVIKAAVNPIAETAPLGVLWYSSPTGPVVARQVVLSKDLLEQATAEIKAKAPSAVWPWRSSYDEISRKLREGNNGNPAMPVAGQPYRGGKLFPSVLVATFAASTLKAGAKKWIDADASIHPDHLQRAAFFAGALMQLRDYVRETAK